MIKLNNKLIVILLIIFVFGCASSVLASSSIKYGKQTKTSHCLANKDLPDSACTPGAVYSTSTDLICDKNYLKKILNVKTEVEKKVYTEYGITTKLRKQYKLDHLISLELGGSNNIANLWPEANNLKNSGVMKDKLSKYLHAKVCSGDMKIAEAQKEISTNWLTYYKKYFETPKLEEKTATKGSTATSTVSTSTAVSNWKIIADNTCTSWVYSNWSLCTSFGIQTREILSSLPTKCAGGNYVLEQACVAPYTIATSTLDMATTTLESATNTILSASSTLISSTTTLADAENATSSLDDLILAAAYSDYGKNVGLSCKPWVNRVFNLATKSSSSLPFLQANNYTWGLSSMSRVLFRSAAIETVKRADIIQFNMASKKNLPHTAIIVSATPTGMIWIHSNWQKALTVSVDFITYEYFKSMAGTEYSIYHLF